MIGSGSIRGTLGKFEKVQLKDRILCILSRVSH